MPRSTCSFGGQHGRRDRAPAGAQPAAGRGRARGAVRRPSSASRWPCRRSRSPSRSLLVGCEPSARPRWCGPCSSLLWAAAGAGAHHPPPAQTRLGPLVLVGATVGAVGALASALETHRSPTGAGGAGRRPRRPACPPPCCPPSPCTSSSPCPTGILATTGRRRGVSRHVRRLGRWSGWPSWPTGTGLIAWPLSCCGSIAFGGGLAGAHARYQTAGATDRRRMQWVGLGAGGGRRGGARRHRPERADRPSRRPRGVGHRRDRASFPLALIASTHSARPSPGSTGCSPTPSRWPA